MTRGGESIAIMCPLVGNLFRISSIWFKISCLAFYFFMLFDQKLLPYTGAVEVLKGI